MIDRRRADRRGVPGRRRRRRVGGGDGRLRRRALRRPRRAVQQRRHDPPGNGGQPPRGGLGPGDGRQRPLGVPRRQVRGAGDGRRRRRHDRVDGVGVGHGRRRRPASSTARARRRSSTSPAAWPSTTPARTSGSTASAPARSTPRRSGGCSPPEAAPAQGAQAHLLGRIGRPEEIAAAAVWLCIATSRRSSPARRSSSTAASPPSPTSAAREILGRPLVVRSSATLDLSGVLPGADVVSPGATRHVPRCGPQRVSAAPRSPIVPSLDPALGTCQRSGPDAGGDVLPQGGEGLGRRAGRGVGGDGGPLEAHQLDDAGVGDRRRQAAGAASASWVTISRCSRLRRSTIDTNGSTTGAGGWVGEEARSAARACAWTASSGSSARAARRRRRTRSRWPG